MKNDVEMFKQILLIFKEIIIATIPAYISYKKLKKKTDAKIKEVKTNAETEINKMVTELQEVKINAETEISKIKEETKKEIERIKAESSREIDKIKTEHEEYRKTKANDSKLNSKEQAETLKNNLAMSLISNLMNNPDEAEKQFEMLEKISKKTSKKRKK